MANSISKLPNSAETMNLTQWSNFSDQNKFGRLGDIQSLRDPLRRISFRTADILAVYGYHIVNTNAYLIYFWQEDMNSLRWRQGELKSSKAFYRKKANLSEYLELGIMLGNVYEHEPTMKPASDLLKEFNNQNILPNSEYLKENCEVFWEKASEHSNKLELETSIKFACVYLKDRFNDPERQINDSKPSGSKSKNKKSSHRTSRNSSSAIPEALEFHRDYFHLRSPIWESVPMTTLLQSSSNSSEDLAKIHLHPKTFNPLESFHDDRFLWPWQRCFKLNKNREFEYSSIKTVSLVFDLRNSTVAMEQLPKGKLGHYSPFLERVIDRAKVIIMLHGGFFDKETGDGIVAHFTDVLHLDKSQKRAFDAAVQIIHDISKICDDFQKKLNLGIENLSPSVGLHEEMSVWVAESNQIRAVGESVILASRLCDETDPKAIFISNSFYQSINDCVLDEIKRRFVKKTYYGKENGNTPSYYGYQVNF